MMCNTPDTCSVLSLITAHKILIICVTHGTVDESDNVDEADRPV